MVNKARCERKCKQGSTNKETKQ